MRKEAYRDYAVQAFRRYAALEQDETQWSEYRRDASEPERRDMEAVERLLEEALTWKNGVEAIEALRIVYMDEPDARWSRQTISRRVKQAAKRIPASERHVYGLLAKCRRAFAQARGLRV